MVDLIRLLPSLGCPSGLGCCSKTSDASESPVWGGCLRSFLILPWWQSWAVMLVTLNLRKEWLARPPSLGGGICPIFCSLKHNLCSRFCPQNISVPLIPIPRACPGSLPLTPANLVHTASDSSLACEQARRAGVRCTHFLFLLLFPASPADGFLWRTLSAVSLG